MSGVRFARRFSVSGGTARRQKPKTPGLSGRSPRGSVAGRCGFPDRGGLRDLGQVDVLEEGMRRRRCQGLPEGGFGAWSDAHLDYAVTNQGSTVQVEGRLEVPW